MLEISLLEASWRKIAAWLTVRVQVHDAHEGKVGEFLGKLELTLQHLLSLEGGW